MKKTLYTLSIVALMLQFSCSDDEKPYYPPPASGEEGTVVGTANMWVTSGDKSRLIDPQDNLSIVDNTTTTYPSITVNEGQEYQEIEGFGAALTGSSAYVINNMGASQKNALLQELFDDENGIGISYLRVTIGSSDFSLSDFTYDDMPGNTPDETLANFSIAPDQTNLIPVLQSILNVSPNIKILGSPWSAPAWMKTNQSLYGGKLKTEYYQTYANYFQKYIEAYANNGITIDAITPQNEPLHEAGYPSMKMEATEQANFIKTALGPTFVNNGITTKIIAYDHNFDVPSYPMTVLADADANQYVAGSAFHAYAGDVSAMGTVHTAYPNKGLYFTEISGGEWSTDFTGNLNWYVRNILIGSVNNWSKNVLFWNLALNDSHGPTNNGCEDCRGVVTVNGAGQVTLNEEYYALAHFAKFVKPGAHRISSTSFDSSTGLYNVAFMNPDGSKVLVVLNESPSSKTFSVIVGENKFNCTLPQESVSTITWE